MGSMRGKGKQMKTNNKIIIIDWEFNGLPKFNFKSEICQCKLAIIENNKIIYKLYNFKTRKAPQYGALNKTGTITGTKLFSQKQWEKIKKENNITNEDNFIGFSIKTDITILNTYGIDLNYVGDLQEIATSTRYERDIALNGRAMETIYFLVCGQEFKENHGGIEELYPLVEMYKKLKNLRKKKFFTIFPYGENAGMPLKAYCENNRRRADGYRFNNDDKLSASLSHYCDIIDEEEYNSYL